MLYEKFDRYWKIWMFIPIALLIISLILIANHIATTGYFMDRNVELSGGKMITVGVESADLAALRQAMPYAQFNLVSGITKTLQIEIPFEENETELLNELKNYVTETGTPTIKTVGPALGELFFNQAQLAILLAFIFMAVVVFILFRSLVPSSIVLLCAGTDIIVSIAFSSLFGIELSLPVLAALLTVIGYSVDTDILLTSELLKTSKGDIKHGLKHATKTGLTMSLTTLTALLGLYFVSGSFVLEQMAFVLIIGILIDMAATWLTNAGILRWWLIRKEEKKMRDKNE